MKGSMTIIVFYDLMKKYQNLHVHVTWYNSSKEGMYSALALPLPECLNVFTAKSKNPIHTFSLTHEIKNPNRLPRIMVLYPLSVTCPPSCIKRSNCILHVIALWDGYKMVIK